MRVRLKFLFCFLFLSCAATHATHAGDDEFIGPRRDTPATAPRFPFVLDSTFEARVKGSPRNQPMSGEMLILSDNSASFSGPVLRVAGQQIIEGAAPDYDFDPSVWMLAPKVPAMDEYLKKRAENPLSTGTELADWCAKNKLPECEAFEIKRLMSRFKSFTEPGYAALNKRWLQFADKRQVEWIFPLPLSGEWTVNPDPTQHHRLKAGAAYAFDMVIVKNGAMFRNNPSRLDNYYAWEQPILAQADGVVAQVRDNLPDAPAGQSNGFDNANYVTVYYGAGISALYAHCRQNSARVKVGDRVKPGDTLALAGNSGAAGFPHVHFTLLDSSYMSIRGRYRVEVQRGATWVLVDGEDLHPGDVVRNPPNVFK
jgi:hypothetical protein